MKEELIVKAYEIAQERYASIGIDTEKAMDALQNIQLSLHCWQTDDVSGFEASGERREAYRPPVIIQARHETLTKCARTF